MTGDQSPFEDMLRRAHDGTASPGELLQQLTTQPYWEAAANIRFEEMAAFVLWTERALLNAVADEVDAEFASESEVNALVAEGVTPGHARRIAAMQVFANALASLARLANYFQAQLGDREPYTDPSYANRLGLTEERWGQLFDDAIPFATRFAMLIPLHGRMGAAGRLATLSVVAEAVGPSVYAGRLRMWLNWCAGGLLGIVAESPAFLEVIHPETVDGLEALLVELGERYEDSQTWRLPPDGASAVLVDPDGALESHVVQLGLAAWRRMVGAPNATDVWEAERRRWSALFERNRPLPLALLEGRGEGLGSMLPGTRADLELWPSSLPEAESLARYFLMIGLGQGEPVGPPMTGPSNTWVHLQQGEISVAIRIPEWLGLPMGAPTLPHAIEVNRLFRAAGARHPLLAWMVLPLSANLGFGESPYQFVCSRFDDGLTSGIADLATRQRLRALVADGGVALGTGAGTASLLALLGLGVEASDLLRLSASGFFGAVLSRLVRGRDRPGAA